MSETAFVAEPVEFGYSQVPHGLWTLDMSGNAKCLLGWLHSHTPGYLARLSITRCENEFGGGGSIRVWFRELEERGFLRKEKVGNRWLITLLAEPWVALHGRGQPAESADGPDESADPADQTRRSGQLDPAESADRGDHVLEDQGEETTPAAADGGEVVDHPALTDSFEAFWETYEHTGPRKKAWECWRRAVKKDTPDVILVGLQRWMDYWRSPGATRIKWPQGWLNAETWRDEPPPVSCARGGRPRAVSENPYVEIFQEMRA